jgi:primosomal protein N' (replication factor Y)
MQRTTYFADVIVPLGVPNKYTYRVPADFNGEVEPGKRVLVQFGKTKIYTGIIYAVHEQAPRTHEAKYIEAVLDDSPVVNATQLRFWDWISFYYCANPGDVMNAALPSGLKLSSTSHVQLHPDFNFEEANHSFFTEREHLVIDALHATPNLEMDNLAELLNVKSAQPIVNNLLRKNAVVIYEDVKDKYKPKLQPFIQLEETYSDEKKLGALLDTLEKKAFKQAEALLYYLHLQKTGSASGVGWIKKNELAKKSDSAAITALIKKKIFIEQQYEVGRLSFGIGGRVDKALSSKQQTALGEIQHAFSRNKTVLLQGVTGSGKTEIYISLIKETLKKNRQVLYLIPEIGLTTQLITRLQAVFGSLVGVYHSRFSENERVEIWNNIQQQSTATANNSEEQEDDEKKQFRIILGARSSIFLPYKDLGLIIVDEEHDGSFKQQDPSPRYHARDAALYLATLHKADVLLGSATPSVESYYNATQGKYQLVTLDQQFAEKGGTQVHLCDVNYFEKTNQMRACLTPPLFESIEAALAKKEQVILFQNRRGFAPYTECRQCGHVPHCVQCDVALIYHKQRQKLVCHYCGYTVTPPKTCTACGSNQLHYRGIGTEKVEEEIEILFPTAKIARMDLDSTRSKFAYKQLIDDFEERNIDILIGTQMVTKGLDFNNVSVVGVLNADAVLNFPDFRSFERAFQLFTQVRGRAGRSDQKGAVYIQTSQSDHKILTYISEGKSNAFFEETLVERKEYNYPPFSRLFEINVISKDINEVNHLANELFALLKRYFGDQLLGPEFPLVAKIKNQYYKRILIKTSKQKPIAETREFIFTSLNELQANYKDWRYRIAIDVDPV